MNIFESKNCDMSKKLNMSKEKIKRNNLSENLKKEKD